MRTMETNFVLTEIFHLSSGLPPFTFVVYPYPHVRMLTLTFPRVRNYLI